MLRCAVMRWNCLSQTAVPVVRIAGRNQNASIRYWKASFYHAFVKGKREKVAFCFRKNSGKRSGRRGRRFDEQFAPKKKEFRPSQEEFYIHSHSVIR